MYLKSMMPPAVLLIVSCGIGIIIMMHNTSTSGNKTMNKIYTSEQITQLFAYNAQTLSADVETATQKARHDIEAIIALAADKRTYATTFGVLDYIGSCSPCARMHNICTVLEMLSAEQSLRAKAHDLLNTLQNFFIDMLSTNRQLYLSLKEYVDANMQKEQLSDAQRYFIDKTMQDFELIGMHKNEKERAHINKLTKEIAKLCLEFETEIAKDTSSITFDSCALAGVSEDAQKLFTKNDDGTYTVLMNYPSIDVILKQCTVAATRKAVSIAFSNRAYPENEQRLKEIIHLRSELAQALGYSTFAALDVADQMAKSTSAVRTFLDDLARHVAPKALQEHTQLLSDLPPSVVVLPKEQLAGWDVSFAQEAYKKKHFALDDEVISHYFPTQKTIDGLLRIYSSFFSLSFKRVNDVEAWDKTVEVVQVYKKRQLLGTLLLDLYPRAHKYSHACFMSVLPAYIAGDGSQMPGVGVVVANFPQGDVTRPSLLTFDDVTTFFHEFGHALHSLLGSTTIASLSGTATKRDFVELPSQLLEEWLWDREILKMVSCHYQTQQSLPDDVIDTIIGLKNFDIGLSTQRQLYFAFLSLHYYESDGSQDLQSIAQKLYNRYVTHTPYCKEAHKYASFGHLTNYAAKYYGYLWSKVFALDVFAHIKREGLLNPAVGERYIQEILAYGGTKDPNILLQNFLGRAPNNHAFLANIGIDA